MDAHTRREIEAWFVRRGVPQLVEGYTSEQSMDARATPFIFAWLLLGSVFVWGTRPDAPLAVNAATALGSFGLIVVGVVLANRLRGRPALRRPPRYDLLDIAVFGCLPALPAWLLFGSTEAAVLSAGTCLSGIAVIFVVVAFGLVSIAIWALRWVVAQSSHVVRLVARTLPLLLILVAFLLFASEIWQAAHTIGPHDAVGVAVLLLAAAVSFLASRLGPELAHLERTTSWAEIVPAVGGTPAERTAEQLDTDRAPVAPLTRAQRSNVFLLTLLTQLVQSLLVGLVVFLFLVGFGLLALPGSLQEVWVGEAVQPLVALELLGETRMLSAELLTVTALLGGFVAVYFSGFSLSDRTYREEALAEVLAEVRRILAVRAVYHVAVSGTSAASAREGERSGRPERAPTGTGGAGTPAVGASSRIDSASTSGQGATARSDR